MGEFYHGWRRKIGCVTLVMACVVAAAWLRSFVVWDEVCLISTTGYMVQLCSDRGQLGFEHESLSEWEEPSALEVEWNSQKPAPDFALFGYLNQPIESFEWRRNFAGISIGVYDFRHSAFCILPYWCIALPLSLLSAYLILRKPRKKATQPVSAPISN